MNKFIYFTAFLTLISVKTYAMEEQAQIASPRSSTSLQLSPETLTSMLPPMPSDQEEIVREWKDSHAALLEQLNAVVSFRGDVQSKQTLLKEHGLLSKAQCSIIFQIPNSEYLIKLATTVNKRLNYAARNQQAIERANALESKLGSLTPGSTEYIAALQEWFNFWDEQYTQYTHNPTPFYQATSRAERYVLLKKALEEQQLDTLYVADAHVIPFAGQTSASVSDQTHFVVERIVPDMTVIDVASDTFKALSAKTMVQLLAAIKAGYLWSIPSKNLGIREDQRTVVLFDLEQPNRLSPEDAFLKNKPLYEKFALQGVQSLLQEVQKHGTQEQRSALKTAIQHDAELQHYCEFESRVTPYL